ncbi:hypothetical protein TrST_g1448 [Triparma strigata]|uniref:Tyrosine-protein kinase ephrin type A/B receptor-like domain-containing protein n=1 Tax=Triparma strigata TaxID=1606541 RepID=A0A9W6ZKD5_9STRA|nr:hypothetical protein TrST_g1448 [Triparma strigata]
MASVLLLRLPLTLLLPLLLLAIPASPTCSSYQSVAPDKVENQWRALSDDVITRRGHVAVALNDDQILLYGGIEKANARNQVANDPSPYVYSRSTGQGSKHSYTSFDGTPSARFGHAAWKWLNSTYFYSGFTQDYTNDLWRIDLPGFTVNQNATFRQVNSTASSPVPVKCYGGIASVLWQSNAMQVVMTFGGTGEGAVNLDAVQLLLLTDGSDSGVCGVSQIGSGETCGDYVAVRTDTVALWATADTSSSVSSPLPRTGHASVTPTGSLCTYIFGGTTTTGDLFGDLWRLCPETNPANPSSYWGGGFSGSKKNFLWKAITPNSTFVPTARYGHIMHELVAGRFLVHGGSGAWPDLFMSKEAEYDIEMNVWVEPDLGISDNLRYHGGTVTPSGELVFFGGEGIYGNVASVFQTNYTSSRCGAGFAQIYCADTISVVCEPCQPGFFSGAGDYVCSECPSGSFSTDVFSIECTMCLKGEYGDGSEGGTSAGHCLKCPTGKASGVEGAPGLADCAQCPGGTFSGLGAWNCTDCDAGFYSAAEASVCSSCLAGTFSAAASASCSACSAGKISALDEATACTNCVAGRYSGGGASECVDCIPGTFSSSDASSSCDDCVAGRYQESSAQTSCDLCAAGKTSAAVAVTSSSTCTDCGKGKYAASTGMDACVDCEAGKYQSVKGQSSCDLCGYGKYSTSTRAKTEGVCLSCPVGRFTPSEGSSSYSDCSTCPAGKYSLPEEGAGCQECQRGRYTADAAMASKFNCTLCDRNFYTDAVGQVACVSCDAGKFSHLGYSKCIDCGLTSSDSASTEAYSGSLQGFYLGDEILDWLNVDGKVEEVGGGPAEGIGSLTASAGDSNLEMAATLDFEVTMPLVLRGHAKGTGVVLSDPSEFGLSLSILGGGNGAWEHVLFVEFDASDSGWQFKEEWFYPTREQVSQRATVELKFEGSAGTVEWAGVGLYNSPSASCDCADGEYMNLDTPNCRTCVDQPTCRAVLAECYRCPAGYACGAGVMMKCGEGEYSWGGELDCQQCEPGWICENGLALPCASDGSIKENGVCVDCPPGFNCRNGVKYQCVEGTYSVGGNGAAGKQCINCEPGKFAGGKGSASCDVCPVGKTSNHGASLCFDDPP